MQTFPRALQTAYETHPDRVAVHLLFAREPDFPITYRQLIEGAQGYAATLADAGIQPGEVVILILDHGADLIYAFFGAVLHGAIPSILPYLTEKLSPEHYRKSLAALFAITAPAAVITAPEFAEEVEQARAERPAPFILQPSTFNLQPLPFILPPSSLILPISSSSNTPPAPPACKKGLHSRTRLCSTNLKVTPAPSASPPTT